MGLRQGHPVLMQTTRFLHEWGRLAEQDRIASQAKHKISPAPLRDHLHDFWGREMTVTTDQDVGMGPVATQIRQQAHQDHGIFGPGGAGPRPQIGGHQRLGSAFENEQWQVAMVPIVMVIKGKLLLPMRGIIGMVHIEHNSLRRLGVTRNKVVDQGPCETIEVFAVYLVF
jgi:hypothetical protein